MREKTFFLEQLKFTDTAHVKKLIMQLIERNILKLQHFGILNQNPQGFIKCFDLCNTYELLEYNYLSLIQQVNNINLINETFLSLPKEYQTRKNLQQVISKLNLIRSEFHTLKNNNLNTTINQIAVLSALDHKVAESLVILHKKELKQPNLFAEFLISSTKYAPYFALMLSELIRKNLLNECNYKLLCTEINLDPQDALCYKPKVESMITIFELAKITKQVPQSEDYLFFNKSLKLKHKVNARLAAWAINCPVGIENIISDYAEEPKP